MSIFGVKRKNIDTLSLRQDISNMRGQLFPQINEIYDVVNKMRVDHRLLNNEVEKIDNEVEKIDNEVKKIDNEVEKIDNEVEKIDDKVEKITDRKIISIFAESKGVLVDGEVFSFGNGGKEVGVGYVMNFPGQILGIGLSSARLGGDVSVVVSIDGNHQTGYGITLGSASRGYYNFDKPLRVEAGDEINFVCEISNNTCVNTVASMIIELFI